MNLDRDVNQNDRGNILPDEITSRKPSKQRKILWFSRTRRVKVAPSKILEPLPPQWSKINYETRKLGDKREVAIDGDKVYIQSISNVRNTLAIMTRRLLNSRKKENDKKPNENEGSGELRSFLEKVRQWEVRPVEDERSNRRERQMLVIQQFHLRRRPKEEKVAPTAKIATTGFKFRKRSIAPFSQIRREGERTSPDAKINDIYGQRINPEPKRKEEILDKISQEKQRDVKNNLDEAHQEGAVNAFQMRKGESGLRIKRRRVSRHKIFFRSQSPSPPTILEEEEIDD